MSLIHPDGSEGPQKTEEADLRSFRERINQDGYVLNFYCTVPAPLIAELAAKAGFDAVTLDMQHGLIDYAEAVAMISPLAGRDVVPMVRTPPLDPRLIMKLLDAGVLGITCALIESGTDAEALVRACRYPPRGERSFGPLRAGLVHDGYYDRADELVTVLAMLESRKGFDNLDEILAVDGIDGIYIGPMDLALSMGHAPSLDVPQEVSDAIDHILRRCREAGKICGMIAPDGAHAATLVERGFSFVTISNDIRAIDQTIKGWLGDARKAKT